MVSPLAPLSPLSLKESKLCAQIRILGIQGDRRDRGDTPPCGMLCAMSHAAEPTAPSEAPGRYIGAEVASGLQDEAERMAAERHAEAYPPPRPRPMRLPAVRRPPAHRRWWAD